MATKMLLEDAARYGKLDILDYLVKENPAAVADFKLKSPDQPLLHEATKCQHLRFVRELMKIDPDAPREMDRDGFRALDIAVIIGNLEIVKELLRFNRDLCVLKGKDGKTALHHAAINGRVDAIDVLLNSCPGSIGDPTVHAETALHLAVKNHQFDAFSALLGWVERLRKLESMVNVADHDGNTILHLAVITKQYACVDVLLAKTRGRIDINARNDNGWTVIDVVDIQDSYDMKMNEKLENEGAVRSPASSDAAAKWVKHASARYYKPKHDSDESTEDWFTYFKFKMQRDSPSDTRNALLVVAALIATVCFQAGVEPPGGLFFGKSALPTSPPPPPPLRPGPPPPPAFIWPGLTSGVGVVASISGLRATSLMFLFANSLGLTASTCIIIYLTAGFPFQREFHMALYSMMFTYSFAIHSIIKDEDKNNKIWAYVVVTLAFTLPFALRWLPRWGRKAWIQYRRNRNAIHTPIFPIRN